MSENPPQPVSQSSDPAAQNPLLFDAQSRQLGMEKNAVPLHSGTLPDKIEQFHSRKTARDVKYVLQVHLRSRAV